MNIGTQGAGAPADLAWLRGMDAYTMGAYPQAEEEFRAAVRLDPGMADGWLGLHALRVDTTTALLRMYQHRDRFGEQRTRHRRTLNSWYWLGWWVQPVLESARDLLLAHASHWLDGRHVPELDRALAGLPPVDTDPQVRFLHACRSYLVKDWEQLVRCTEQLVDDPMLGIEAGLFGGMARVRLEMFGQAEPLLSAALMRCRSEQPQRKELRYWLARAHEGTGRSAAALPLYRAVHRVDPAFMDTSARLAALVEGDGYDEAADLAAVSLSGFGAGAPGAEALPEGDALLGLDPLDGREAWPLGDGVLLGDEPAPGPPDPVEGSRRTRIRKPPPFPAGPSDPALLADALAQLERMVGLEPVKRQVKALSAQLNMARLRAEQGLPVQPPKRHFVFSGPSGTGKTTVARILGRVFYALGLLGGDHLVEAQRSDLVGEFLGQTAVKANELIDSALGGVLFVDEAYSLANSGYSKGDAYGDEALQVLLKRAEDNRDHLVVILAGYPEGMDRLLATNPGLSSRFTTRVDFPSYRPLELTAIGGVLAAENDDVWDEESVDELRSISGHVVDQGWIDELGNGRFLRTLYEKSCAYRDLRLSGYRSAPTREDLSTLRLPDLMQAYGEVLSGRGPVGRGRQEPGAV
ncbi:MULTISPECIES: AAA family ATPase [Streptomyces]|uniref:AAA family ATPase n=1 Tax=Streptomyces californicus TaxID=67351 RepID=A0ABD7D5I0_9ACTN|nr:MULTISPECIES: AAA family ATPase [Streptomyces]MDW4913991.1 AAA family ATPase [Streptomyces californicus]QRV26590.1 AAA family ATPase [Streptomyces californicus]QRV37747.1 AAA family ATPase [Streptomyces californicus]QRV39992.1 AAA family ATPase [Streptomyces californicus]QRV46741.1 AAA family ATPase [Streptomyces californicus]